MWALSLHQVAWPHIFFSSVTQSCPTICDPRDCSTPGFPIHHQLLELSQIHVHQVGDAIQASHPLSSPSPPAFNPSQHQGLFQWVSSGNGTPLQYSCLENPMDRGGLGYREDSRESFGLPGDQASQSWRKSILNIHWKDCSWSWSSDTLATWCEELIYCKRPWCWGKLRAEGEEGNRGWDD